MAFQVLWRIKILVHGADKAELAKPVSNVLDRLLQKDGTINSKKSSFCTSEIKFLGHVLSGDGIKPDPEIMNKIKSCKSPQDRSELESFLGLVYFFGRIIKGFYTLTQPLHGLRKKDVPYSWDPTH